MRAFIALAFAVFGIAHLVYRDFVTRVLPKLPAWVPQQSALAIAIGIALIAVAFALALNKTKIALGLGIVLLAFALIFHLPLAIEARTNGGLWTNFGKGLTLAACAFVIADLKWLPRYLLGSFLILCGVEHFIYVKFVESLIPAWIPGHEFWAYFAGVALIAGGLGLMIPWTARLAALMSGIMILSWVPLVHIPLALRNLSDAGQTVPVFEALAFGAASILISSAGKRENQNFKSSERAMSKTAI